MYVSKNIFRERNTRKVAVKHQFMSTLIMRRLFENS